MPRKPPGKTVRRSLARKPAKRAAKSGAPSALLHSPTWRTMGAGGGAPKGAGPGGVSRCSGIVVEPQQQTQWCWAAVSDSVSHYYDPGSPWTQCTIVNAELNQTTCCTDGSSAGCNQPWYLDLALTRVGRLQSVIADTLPFATLQALTSANNPPCVRQGWTGGGGHFLAVACCFQFRALGPTGSSASGSSNRVSVSDPWYGDSIVDYATLVSGYQGTGTWTHSYLTQP